MRECICQCRELLSTSFHHVTFNPMAARGPVDALHFSIFSSVAEPQLRHMKVGVKNSSFPIMFVAQEKDVKWLSNCICAYVCHVLWGGGYFAALPVSKHSYLCNSPTPSNYFQIMLMCCSPPPPPSTSLVDFAICLHVMLKWEGYYQLGTWQRQLEGLSMTCIL